MLAFLIDFLMSAHRTWNAFSAASKIPVESWPTTLEHGTLLRDPSPVRKHVGKGWTADAGSKVHSLHKEVLGAEFWLTGVYMCRCPGWNLHLENKIALCLALGGQWCLCRAIHVSFLQGHFQIPLLYFFQHWNDLETGLSWFRMNYKIKC